MVYSSVYRRAYKDPSWDDCSKKEFFRKLQYRSDRRSVEHRHQPWRWDSESEDEDIEEIPAEDGSYDGARRRRVPHEEKLNDERIPRQAWEEERKEVKGNKHAADKGLVLPERLKYDEEEEEKKRKQSHLARHGVRPKEGDDSKGIDNREQERSSEDNRKHRSKSTSPAKKRRSKEKKSKVPFLPYGMGNEGPVDMWKTHNVMASQQEVSKQTNRKNV